MMEGAIRSARAAQPVAIDLPRPVLTRNGHGGVAA
jgi:hypothetical protein